jgi:UPF0755 protein
MTPLFGGRGGGSDEERRARSDEAREQARREREAKRAIREGRDTTDPEPPYAPAPAPADAWAPEPDAWASALEPEAVPVPEPELAPEAEVEADHWPPEPAAEQAAEPVAEHPADVAPAPEPEFAPEAPAPAFADDDLFADDEPFAAAPDPHLDPDPEPAPEPAAPPEATRPRIPPRPALSWETDDGPARVDPPTRDQPAAQRTPPPATPPRPSVELGPDADDPGVRVLAPDGEGDRPLGTRRVAASTFATAAGADGPPRFGAPPRGRGRGTPRSRRGMKRIGPALVILVLLLVAYSVNKVMQPFHGDGNGAVRVVIPPGSGARQIGDELAKAGVVDSGLIFSLRARISGDRDKLRSGPHLLKKDMSYKDALTALTVAPKVAPTVDVAIPEGLTIKQVGSLAHRAKLSGSYTKATRSAAARKTARALGAPKRVKTLEGFLFPATYRLRTTATTGTLVTEQLKTFERETAKIDYAFAKKKQLTRYDVLIIASLIENEAQTAKDRPLIAAVVYNRLRQGIPLQIDATTRYETGNYGENARPIRQSELEADTPYNTRIRKGLPPTPISSPGVAALQAAAHPANVPYIYYVVKPCGNGAHSFSSTDAKFQQDVAAYNRKREQLGGKDPSTC